MKKLLVQELSLFIVLLQPTYCNAFDGQIKHTHPFSLCAFCFAVLIDAIKTRRIVPH